MDQPNIVFEQIDDNLLDMAHIVKIQLQKSKYVLFNHNRDQASEVVENNKRIEILNLQINHRSKDFLDADPLMKINIQRILATIAINNRLERIGYHSKNICKRIITIDCMFSQELMKEFKLDKLYGKAIKMIDHIIHALENHDRFLAGKIFKNGHSLRKISNKVNFIATGWLEKYPQDYKVVLNLLDIISDIEFIYDQIKNMNKIIVTYLTASYSHTEFLTSEAS